MSKSAGSISFLPRFTTLVGAASFATTPIDTSKLDSVTLHVWRGALAGSGGPTFTVYLEESLDGENWTQGPSAPTGYDPGANTAKFLTYCFQLPLFRVRVDLAGTNPMVTCWAAGVLR